MKLLLPVLAMAGLAVPFQDVAYPVLVMNIMALSIFAASFNLLLGFGGLLSFGHAAFFGASAYAAVLACGRFGLTPELGLLLGIAIAALLGLAIGTLAIRRQGIYFAMITLALAQMVFFIAAQWPLLGGEDGLRSSRGRVLGVFDVSDDRAMYYFAYAVFLACMAFVWRVVNSPFGELLHSIRENELRALSLGYDTARYKLLAFVLSAALAGAAGALKGLVLQLATLSDLHWHTSGEVIVMVILGGLGTLAGPVVGAAIVTGLQHALISVGALAGAVTGIVFMLCVLAFRRGVVGEALQALRRFQKG